jgi:hypothetical protein
VIWASAELAITIMAAAIPVLRSLFVQVGATAKDKTRQFRSITHDEVARRSKTHKPGVNMVTISAMVKRLSTNRHGNDRIDEDSDGGLCEDAGGVKVTRTAEVQVNFTRTSERDSGTLYEMDKMASQASSWKERELA